MSIVATRPKLIRALFAGSCPEEGFFVCKFFIQGEWRWIVIDDALPVTASGNICFGRCRESDSFWVPLLEKARVSVPVLLLNWFRVAWHRLAH